MILSDRCIRRALGLNRIRIAPLDSEQQIQPASVDLRLLEHHIICGPGYRDEVIGPITLQPGSYAIASTVERVSIPDDLAAQVAGKSSIARMGVQVECAGWIDPGFEGQITLELANLGTDPVTLQPGTKICQIVFLQLTSPCIRPYGSKGLGSHYQNQTGPTLASEEKEFVRPEHLRH